MMQQIPLPLPYSAAMGADDFLVTGSNRDAVSWIEKWPDWPTHGLIICGPSSSGKTHLLNLWKAKASGRILQSKDIAGRSAGDITAEGAIVAIDNADDFAGDAVLEEALFHLYNDVMARKGWLVLAMKKGAGQVGFALPDLRSRLMTLPVATLGNPDDILLEALIVKQFRDRQVDVDVGVVRWMASRMPRDAAGISEIVADLDKAALAAGSRITIALARKIMENVYEE